VDIVRWLFWVENKRQLNLLSEGVIDVSSIRFSSSKPSLAAEGHQFISGISVLHVRVIAVKKHIFGFFPESKTTFRLIDCFNRPIFTKNIFSMLPVTTYQQLLLV